MRIILASLGSKGNTQPILALAVELRKRGQEAVLALQPKDAAESRRLGFEFVPLLNDATGAAPPGPDPLAELVDDPTKYDSLEYMHALAQEQAGAMPRVFERLSAAVRGADMLVSAANLPVSRMVHEITGIPFVAFHTFYLADSQTQLGDEGNPVYREVTELHINRYRQQLGLQPLSNPMTRNGDSPQLTLFAISPAVVPQPGGWPSHYHMPGYFFLDDDDWQPPAELLRFIAAGDPPIAVSFGSVPYSNPEQVTAILKEAIQASGQRAIIQCGLGELGKGDLPTGMLAVDYVPHAWLFSRVSCVVHHGGSGTAAAALRAGVPSVCVPHVFDQPIWSRLVYELGCASKPIHFKKLTVERLASAINEEVKNTEHKQKASAIGEQIRAERGVERACALIEALWEKKALAR